MKQERWAAPSRSSANFITAALNSKKNPWILRRVSSLCSYYIPFFDILHSIHTILIYIYLYALLAPAAVALYKLSTCELKKLV